jgi:predicted ATPase
MTAQLRSENTQMLLVNLLRRIVGPGSVVILDNAHWLDSASWALTVAVRQQIPGILIILALRKMGEKVPFELNQLMHHSGTTRITLTNLSESESLLFIKQVI